MTNAGEEVVDYLKFATARVLLSHTQFQAILSSPAARDALSILRHLHTELLETVERCCPEGQDSEPWAARYHDGRPVISAMPLEGEGSGMYVHVWHPDRTHPMNNPGNLDVIEAADGTRKQVLVSAPGVLDAVSLVDPKSTNAKV